MAAGRRNCHEDRSRDATAGFGALLVYRTNGNLFAFGFDACGIGIQRDFQDAVPLVAEEIVRFLNLIEGEAVRDQRAQIDASVLDHRHEAAHPLFAARAKRGHDLLIAKAGVKGLVRRHQLAGVHAEA